MRSESIIRMFSICARLNIFLSQDPAFSLRWAFAEKALVDNEGVSIILVSGGGFYRHCSRLVIYCSGAFSVYFFEIYL